MGLGFVSKGECLGVDIGSAQTKVVHLRADVRGPRVETAFWFKTPPECVVEAVVRNSDELADLLKHKLTEHRVPCTNAVAGASGAQVTVREAHLPKMAHKLLNKSVRYEAARYISTPVEQAIVEYQTLGESAEGIDLLLVAAPTELVESRTAVLQRAGLTPAAVDVDVFALYRALIETSQGSADAAQTIVLLDLGAQHTDLNIVKGGRFVLARTLAICGRSMSEAIAPITSGDLEAADELKRAIDLALLQAPEDTDSKPARAARALRPILEEVAKEIRRSINYYKETAQQPEHTRVDKILIAGGGAQMCGLTQFFESNLEIPCEVGDPFSESGSGIVTGSGSSDLSGTAFATALGLAQKELVKVRATVQKAA